MIWSLYRKSWKRKKFDDNKKKMAENAQKPKAFGAQEAQNASLRKTGEAQKEKVKKIPAEAKK